MLMAQQVSARVEAAPGTKQSTQLPKDGWRPEGEETGSGQGHTMVWSQRVERKERTLPPMAWLGSAPMPARVGPQGPTVKPAVH